ncbi:aldehyde dehydrogenase (NADP(+)) [Xanthobacter oligotrophicus]|uniref:aldehyde dehydrogenase (NADP(+)) n=1 Tax=Xanthobacter oligotrophicus TaxID=2607286 RepID=UPI0011F1C1E5|nr:aldehyde dehydrogenase (NADP(+)) [Xanthobacter oligotrophicus]MCG5237993.1 aldehyde dehydrogenase (NADP(+)) [Xanthobacter oligotrophicus]
MDATPDGGHLIAGAFVAGGPAFESAPVSGTPRRFFSATEVEVDAAARAAEDAFASFGWSTRKTRADFLDAIATEMEARGTDITAIAQEETGLPAPRLAGELARTTGQLRLFARHILAGAYLDRRRDVALPDRQPLPRPDIRLMERPIGPVAVFGASNFPLAFSVAGGDTASALAAGCPVVVKGHPAHPGTSQKVAEAIDAARAALGLHPGVFGLLQSFTVEGGTALVRHPLIKAVGFTGSLGAGRALFDLCAARPEPIPFFGELGSVNPMFLLPAALKARGGALGAGWAGSLSLGVGQFCTNPGIAFAVDGPDTDAFLAATQAGLGQVAPQPMLTDGIAAAFRRGRDHVAQAPAVRCALKADADGRNGAPALFETTGAAFRADSSLAHEVFGPLGILVRVEDREEMVALAAGLEGQLTATLQMDADDTPLAKRLMPILERKAGRVLANGFPTGVEVCDAMVHGGPYPASTNFGATSVGTMAIRRFLRPVSYQNLPDALLPADLLEEEA